MNRNVGQRNLCLAWPMHVGTWHKQCTFAGGNECENVGKLIYLYVGLCLPASS